MGWVNSKFTFRFYILFHRLYQIVKPQKLLALRCHDCSGERMEQMSSILIYHASINGFSASFCHKSLLRKNQWPKLLAFYLTDSQLRKSNLNVLLLFLQHFIFSHQGHWERNILFSSLIYLFSHLVPGYGLLIDEQKSKKSSMFEDRSQAYLEAAGKAKD